MKINFNSDDDLSKECRYRRCIQLVDIKKIHVSNMVSSCKKNINILLVSKMIMD